MSAWREGKRKADWPITYLDDRSERAMRGENRDGNVDVAIPDEREGREGRAGNTDKRAVTRGRERRAAPSTHSGTGT